MSGWSVSDIPSQAGKTWVVTGANSGIGLVTARELARAGARVVLGCRDPERGREALEVASLAATGTEPLLVQLDLADLSSVREFASAVSASGESLEGLVNNAGVMAPPREETADGFELQFGTNHLGHFALTGLLLDRLMASEGEARVVTVSSMAHRTGSMDWDDLQGERDYNRWRRYGQSKLSNLLFANELARRSTARGWGIVSTAAHPGYAATHLQTSGPGLGGGLVSLLNVAAMKVTNLIAQSDEKGALPSLYAATAPGVASGAYVGPSGPGEARGHPTLVGSTKAARSEADAKRLWEISEDLTGVSYPASSPVST
ncbi:MAG TPA: oxidoreductase [Solirubrobacterales bacterium]|nr:oxidoreductase [Solirubrobacterales bacterium]